MQAAFYVKQGPAREVLEVGAQPTPEPGPGEVRGRLRSSGVNPPIGQCYAAGPALVSDLPGRAATTPGPLIKREMTSPRRRDDRDCLKVRAKDPWRRLQVPNLLGTRR